MQQVDGACVCLAYDDDGDNGYNDNDNDDGADDDDNGDSCSL